MEKKIRQLSLYTPLVSIIIPVYNVRDYLEECVESVIKQSYENLQIILVDDGSTDGSEKICDLFKNKDPRIEVFHKENGGLSDTRNFGILKSKGEYLFFLDSDDIISKKAIEILLFACINYDADATVTGLKRFEGNYNREEIVEGNFIEMNQEYTLSNMLLHVGFGHEAPGKLYKKNMWKDIKFPFGKLYEDYATIYKVYANAQKVIWYSEPLYYYRVRNGSIMKSYIKEKNLMLMDISDDVTNYIVKAYPNLKNQALYLQTMTYIKLYKDILHTDFKKFPGAQKRIKQKVLENKKMIYKESFIKTSDKIKMNTLGFSKYLFYFVYLFGDLKNKL